MQVGFFSLGRALSEQSDPAEHLKRLVQLAVHAEEAGFDEIALGENHSRPPYALSSPIVVLSHIAARTSRLGLGTAASLITINDPVRLVEDLATLQHLAGPRVSVMLGRGSLERSYAWFGYDVGDSLPLAREKHRLLHRLWTEEDVDWSGHFRAPLSGFTALPRPLAALPVWHVAVRTREIIDDAAAFGDGFFANYTSSRPEDVAAQVRYYRERHAEAGHDHPPRVGSGAKVFVRPRSQDAEREFLRHLHTPELREKFRDVGERSRHTALTVGSPQQVVDKLARFHEAFGGIDRQLFTIDDGAFPSRVLREQVELLASAVLPELRRLTTQPSVQADDPTPVHAAAGG